MLKSDIKRLQDEVQALTKVTSIQYLIQLNEIDSFQTKDDEISKYQKRCHDLQATIDQLESQVCFSAAILLTAH